MNLPGAMCLPSLASGKRRTLKTGVGKFKQGGHVSDLL
jgi:hypothetical protein